ncbi:MAG: TRAP transporter small permease [Cyclobacteriaceae bacterium]
MKKKIDLLLESVLTVLTILMVINVLWQVISRFVFNTPSSITSELAGFMLIWVSLLGAGYAAGQKLHMAIDLLPEALAGPKRLILLRLVHFFMLAFAVIIMIIGGGNLVFLTFQFEQVSATLQIPMGYVYLVSPLSGCFIAYYSIYFMINPDGTD